MILNSHWHHQITILTLIQINSRLITKENHLLHPPELGSNQGPATELKTLLPFAWERRAQILEMFQRLTKTKPLKQQLFQLWGSVDQRRHSEKTDNFLLLGRMHLLTPLIHLNSRENQFLNIPSAQTVPVRSKPQNAKTKPDQDSVNGAT
jgi:hypothetical protein